MNLEVTSLKTRHAGRGGLSRWLPGIAMLSGYNRDLFSQDLVAGLVLTAILVPVGIAYAEAAGLSPIYGLYATIVPLLAYAVCGPSRIMVLGPDSALAALIAATILPLAHGDAGRAASLAAMLAIFTGLLSILAGLARIGFVTDLLSKPIRYGYLNGIAITLLITQLPKMLGFSVPSGSLRDSAQGLVKGLLEGRVNVTAGIIGLSCLGVIFACRRWCPRLPGILVAVAWSTLAVILFDLESRMHLLVIGLLPQGLPALSVPNASISDCISLASGALALALVSIADMSVLSRTFALRGGYYVDENKEMIALGIANVATGFFQGFSVSSSASRTPVAESAGAKTQMTGVVGALCIALLLLFAPGLMMHVPIAALGAVVVSVCYNLVEIVEVRRLYDLRRGEFFHSIVCFLAVALLGVVQGIFISVGFALLAFIWRAWRPYCAVLGRVDGMKGYHDIIRHPEARRIPGLILFRWDAPLFFANAEMFREHILRAVSDAPNPVKWVVVAAEPITDVDITAADVLTELDAELHRAGIDILFAEMKGPVKDCLKRYGLFSKLGVDNFFTTIGQAVDEYLLKHHVVWQDWEDDRNSK
jgi:high affinity sulfate transporter 1